MIMAGESDKKQEMNHNAVVTETKANSTRSEEPGRVI